MISQPSAPSWRPSAAATRLSYYRMDAATKPRTPAGPPCGMRDQLLPLPLIEGTVYLCVDMQGYFRPKVLGRRHGWTGSCQSCRRSRTVTPKERLLPASFRPSVQTKCRACGGAITGAGALRAASAWIFGCWNAAARALCAPVIDKTRYSDFAEPRLIEHSRQRETRRADRLGIRDRCLRARDSAGRG